MFSSSQKCTINVVDFVKLALLITDGGLIFDLERIDKLKYQFLRWTSSTQNLSLDKRHGNEIIPFLKVQPQH